MRFIQWTRRKDALEKWWDKDNGLGGLLSSLLSVYASTAVIIVLVVFYCENFSMMPPKPQLAEAAQNIACARVCGSPFRVRVYTDAIGHYFHRRVLSCSCIPTTLPSDPDAGNQKRVRMWEPTIEELAQGKLMIKDDNEP